MYEIWISLYRTDDINSQSYMQTRLAACLSNQFLYLLYPLLGIASI